MASLEQEFSHRYIKDLTSWIVFHRTIYELYKSGDTKLYVDAEAVLVKLDIPSILKVVKNLYETDRAGLDKLYEQSIKEIDHLKEMINL